MAYINLTTNQFYFGPNMPPGPDWQQVSIEEFNSLIAGGWNPTEYIPPYRVSKDTIVSRVDTAGKLTDLMAMIASLTAEQQFLWDNYAWFWNDNPTVNAMCVQLGLDPAVILAPDPYLT
jgi:hypothetical protein